MIKKALHIHTDGVTFKYSAEITALKDISLHVFGGERVALIGHNGSGKSTLAKHFNGLLLPSAGRVWVERVDTSTQSVSQLARRVALLFQNPDDQICKRRVWDEVAFGPKNLGYSEDKTARLVNNALSLFDLLSLQTTNPHDLGYSERKRVAMGSIVAMDTPIIVLDEPTAGLDSHEIKRLVTTLQKLREEEKTVLIITHDMDFVAENVPRIICLAKGQKTFDGNSQDFFHNSGLLLKCGIVPPQVVRLSTHFQQTNLTMTPKEFITEF